MMHFPHLPPMSTPLDFSFSCPFHALEHVLYRCIAQCLLQPAHPGLVQGSQPMCPFKYLPLGVVLQGLVRSLSLCAALLNWR